ncbi:uncharacterized protein LOC122026469 [Zingiber officinale]|uniref:uncharacterized protein LOC122026469 n=1 Tax=Zingiber officinale TaxID=94328 RepID=UPI001C4AFD00|nr:uncharacterized protein LOC122026469 [Zingiber officinale]
MKILNLTCSSSGCERNWSVFEHIHSKKRNRLSQQRLNDLVYIKYNRALRRRYDMRDKIDPITLSEIDDSNEWLLGKLDDSDKDDDNDFVFEGEDLRWSDVAQASGVGESAYDFRSRNASSSKGTSSSALAKRKQSSAQTSLVNEEEINLDNETEEEDTDGYKSSDGADDIDLDNEDEEDDYFDI